MTHVRICYVYCTKKKYTDVLYNVCDFHLLVAGYLYSLDLTNVLICRVSCTKQCLEDLAWCNRQGRCTSEFFT